MTSSSVPTPMNAAQSTYPRDRGLRGGAHDEASRGAVIGRGSCGASPVGSCQEDHPLRARSPGWAWRHAPSLERRRKAARRRDAPSAREHVCGEQRDERRRPNGRRPRARSTRRLRHADFFAAVGVVLTDRAGRGVGGVILLLGGSGSARVEGQHAHRLAVEVVPGGPREPGDEGERDEQRRKGDRD